MHSPVFIRRRGKFLRNTDDTWPTSLECCCDGDPHKPPGGAADCFFCEVGTARDQIQVEVSGIVSAGGLCCTNYNGTYVLDYAGFQLAEGGPFGLPAGCTWSKSITGISCCQQPAFSDIETRLISSSGNKFLVVRLRMCEAALLAGVVQGSHPYGAVTTVNCRFSESISASAPSFLCNYSNVTFAISPVL